MLVSKKTVYVGADIVTMSEKAPKAEAVCIADGRIECGSEAVLQVSGLYRGERMRKYEYCSEKN